MPDINRFRQSILAVFICLFLAASLVRFVPIFDQSSDSFTRFLNYKFNYQVLRETPYIPRTAAIVRQVLPPASKVKFSYSKWDVYTVWFYYSLYPMEMTENWDYFIDITHSLTEEETREMKTFNLGDGIKIYAKPGHDFNLSGSKLEEYPQARNLLIFACVTAFLTLIGSMVMGCFRISKDEGGAWWYWGTSYLLGLFALTMPLWGFLMAGGMLTRTNILVLWSVLFLGIWMYCKRWPRSEKKESSVVIEASVASYMDLFRKFFQLLAVAAILTVVGDSLSNGIAIWDEMARWIIQAKMIFYHHGLDLHYTVNNYYPMLWPIHVATQFTLLDGMYDESAKWSSALVLLSFMGQLYGAMRFLGLPRILFLSLTGVYFVVFHHPLVFPTALPENLLMAYMAMFMTMILRWLKDPSRENHLFLALVAAAGMSGTKIEGFIAAVFFAAVLFLLAKDSKLYRRAIPWICLLFLMPLIPTGWTFWLKQQGYSTAIYHLSHGFSWQKIFLIWIVFRAKMIGSQNCLFILLSLGMLAVVRNKKPFSVQERFLFLASLTLMGFSVIAALGWPVEDIYPYFMEASGRLLIHASPFIFLLWCSRVFNTRINP